MHLRFTLTLLLVTLWLPAPLIAGEVRVAVAANFTAAMREIAREFEATSGHRTLLSYGSTGKLYTQILYAAPFDLFLAADQRRPGLLAERQLADPPITYAIGRLVLWSAEPARPLDATTLAQGDFSRLAIANPKIAPYGAAAMSVLAHLGVDKALQRKRVFGENIVQTYQFVATGNAELGFVSASQLALDGQGSYWEIPQALYEPIRQDAVLLERGRDNDAAVDLLAYLESEPARRIMRRFGYAIE